MANVKLPVKLDPHKCAQKRSSYTGVYLAKDMRRFSSAVEYVDCEVPVTVEFAKDAQGLTYFSGTLSANVQLICQRCNNAFDHKVEADFCFTPVQGQQDTDLLPDAYDPVEVDDHGEVDLFQLLEDELILALPLVALHPLEDCAVTAKDLQFGTIDESEAVRENPFAVLKELKRD